MKCDVCLTKIPAGENVCPNCGYVMRSDHVNIYDASGTTHDHIQVKSSFLKDRLTSTKQTTKTKAGYRKAAKSVYQKPQNSNIKAKIIAIGVVCVFVFGTLFIPLSRILDFDSLFSDDSDTEGFYDDFQDMIDDGLDEDGTIILAQEEKEELIDYLESQGFEDVYYSDYYNQYTEDNNAQFVVRSSKDNVDYEISMTYRKNTRTSVELTFSGYSSSVYEGELRLSKENISVVTDYIDFPQVITQLEKAHPLMKQDSEYKDRYMYSNYDGPHIYMSEETKTNGEVFYYYNIGFNDM